MTDLDKSETKECEICYQTQLLHNNKIILPCKHELCNNCLKNLRTETCPFCRKPFRKLEYIRTEHSPNIIQNISINITIDYYIEFEEYNPRQSSRRTEINYEQRTQNYEKKYKYILSKNEKNNKRKIRKNHFRNNSAILLY